MNKQTNLSSMSAEREMSTLLSESAGFWDGTQGNESANSVYSLRYSPMTSA